MTTPANLLSEYELERQKNIEKNKLLLLQLGIMDNAFDMRAAPANLDLSKPKRSYYKRLPSDLERRSSDRLVGKVTHYGEEDEEDDEEYEPDDGDEEVDDILPKMGRRVRVNKTAVSRRFRTDGERPTWKPFYGSEISTCHMCYIRNRKPKTKCSQCYNHYWRGHICKDCYDAHFDLGEAAAAAAIAAGATPVEKFDEAVKNVDWICFVCRGTCPCGYCRAGLTKRGKRHFRKESDQHLQIEDNSEAPGDLNFPPLEGDILHPQHNQQPSPAFGDRPRKRRGRPPKRVLPQQQTPAFAATDPADFAQHMQNLMGSSLGGAPIGGGVGANLMNPLALNFGSLNALTHMSSLIDVHNGSGLSHDGSQGPMSTILLNPFEDLLGLDPLDSTMQQGIIHNTIKIENNFRQDLSSQIAFAKPAKPRMVRNGTSAVRRPRRARDPSQPSKRRGRPPKMEGGAYVEGTLFEESGSSSSLMTSPSSSPSASAAVLALMPDSMPTEGYFDYGYFDEDDEMDGADLDDIVGDNQMEGDSQIEELPSPPYADDERALLALAYTPLNNNSPDKAAIATPVTPILKAPKPKKIAKKTGTPKQKKSGGSTVGGARIVADAAAGASDISKRRGRPPKPIGTPKVPEENIYSKVYKPRKSASSGNKRSRDDMPEEGIHEYDIAMTPLQRLCDSRDTNTDDEEARDFKVQKLNSSARLFVNDFSMFDE